MKEYANTFKAGCLQTFFFVVSAATISGSAIFIAAICFGGPSSPFDFWNRLALFIVVGLPLFLVVRHLALKLSRAGALARRRDWQKGQAKRDRRALAILERLSRGDIPKYSVYLRPFAITGKVIVKHQEYQSGPVSEVDKERVRDLEMLFSQALDRYEPMIALGLPGESIGAGRIQTDDQTWIDTISLMIQHSKLLILVPSSNPGTLHEIAMISSNHWLDKTVFIMPPTALDSRLDYQPSWEAAVKSCRAFGLSMPHYYCGGGLFRLNSAGKVCSGCFFPKNFKPKKLRESITDVMRRELMDWKSVIDSERARERDLKGWNLWGPPPEGLDA